MCGPWRTMAEDATLYLLDANLLIALAVNDHVHHGAAERWTSSRADLATCPSTQGSLVRFLVREGASGTEAAGFLTAMLEAGRYGFWADHLGYDDVDLGAVMGHRQVTDAYLASLARAHGGRLATMDRGLAALHPDVTVLVPT